MNNLGHVVEVENSNSVLYSAEKLGKKVIGPAGELSILRNISFSVSAGETVAIVGESGSGKSTLLQILGTLDKASEGAVYYRGKNLSELNPNEAARFRNSCLGFVFQFHYLLPEFSALENVAMQAIISGMPRKLALQKAENALASVGLSHRMSHNVTTLSGGERQRAAIARATLMNPEVLLADEPTGNLDEKNGEQITQLLFDLNIKNHMTLIVVTHNRDLAGAMQRRLEMRSGELYAQNRSDTF